MNELNRILRLGVISVVLQLITIAVHYNNHQGEVLYILVGIHILLLLLTTYLSYSSYKHIRSTHDRRISDLMERGSINEPVN